MILSFSSSLSGFLPFNASNFPVLFRSAGDLSHILLGLRDRIPGKDFRDISYSEPIFSVTRATM